MQSKTKYYHGINKNIGASALSVASNFLARGVGFLFTPVFTRLLAPTEYGIYPQYMSYLGIFTVFVSFEVCGTVMYRGLAKFGRDTESRYVSASLGISVALYITALSLYLPMRNALNRLTGLGTRTVAILITQAFLNTVMGIYLAKKRYGGHHISATVVNALYGIGTPLFSLFLIKSGVGGYSRILSPLAVTAVIAAIVSVKILKKCPRLYDRRIWKFIFGITLPLLPHYLALSLIAQGDKLLLSRLYEREILGIYSAANSLGFLISLITGGIISVLSPWLMRKMSEDKNEAAGNAVQLAVRLGALTAMLFFCVIPELYSLFAPKEYYEALPVAYITALSVFFHFIATVFSSMLLYYEKPALLMRSSVISCIAGLSVGFSASRAFGWIAVALTPLAAYATIGLLNYRNIFRASGKKPINANSCLQISLFTVFFAVIAFWLRAVPVSRILLIFAFFSIFVRTVFKNRKLIVTVRKPKRAKGL